MKTVMKMLDGFAIDFMEPEDGFDAKLGICGKHFDIKNTYDIIDGGGSIEAVDIKTDFGRTYLESLDGFQIDTPESGDDEMENDTRDIIRHIIKELIYS